MAVELGVQGVAADVEPHEERGDQLLVPGADPGAQVLAGRAVALRPVLAPGRADRGQRGPARPRGPVVHGDRLGVAAAFHGERRDPLGLPRLVPQFGGEVVLDEGGQVRDVERDDGPAPGDDRSEGLLGSDRVRPAGEPGDQFRQVLPVLRGAEQQLRVRPPAQPRSRPDERPVATEVGEAVPGRLLAVDLLDECVVEEGGRRTAALEATRPAARSALLEPGDQGVQGGHPPQVVGRPPQPEDEQEEGEEADHAGAGEDEQEDDPDAEVHPGVALQRAGRQRVREHRNGVVAERGGDRPGPVGQQFPDHRAAVVRGEVGSGREQPGGPAAGVHPRRAGGPVLARGRGRRRGEGGAVDSHPSFRAPVVEGTVLPRPAGGRDVFAPVPTHRHPVRVTVALAMAPSVTV